MIHLASSPASNLSPLIGVAIAASTLTLTKSSRLCEGSAQELDNGDCSLALAFVLLF